MGKKHPSPRNVGHKFSTSPLQDDQGRYQTQDAWHKQLGLVSETEAPNTHPVHPWI